MGPTKKEVTITISISAEEGDVQLTLRGDADNIMKRMESIIDSLAKMTS